MRATDNISVQWLKGSVAGGLWASVEIIIGSFLHNLRIPFSGTILAFFGIILLVAFSRMWPEKGIIWRAGLVCAIMKSISPSAVILGPMTGILAESLLLQLFVNLFGRNLTGYFLGGIFSLSSALLHKVISLLILYGFDIFKIYLNLYYYAAKQVRIENADPWILILILAGSYLLFGMIAALLGYVIGNKSLRMASSGPFIPDILEASSGNPESKPEKSYSLLMLAIHVVALPVSLFLINRSGSPVEFLFPGSYFLFMLVMYRNYLGKLKKPFFWLQLMMVTVLATFFWSSATGIPSLTQWQGFYVGLQLNFRALIVVTGFAAISMELKNPVIKQYLVDHGFRNIYLSVDLAFSILPFMMKKGARGRSFFIHPLSSLSSSLSQADQWIEYLRKKP